MAEGNGKEGEQSDRAVDLATEVSVTNRRKGWPREGVNSIGRWGLTAN